MNIFVLDENPQIAAQMHNDKHVVKMILETAQLLCGVHHTTDSQYTDIPYKLSHKNHPCSIWARECIENYTWLCDLGIALCDEYRYRYGKRHKSLDVIEWALFHRPNLPTNGDITPFALAMPDECKVDSVVESYRLYYITHKQGFSKWKKRDTPDWFVIK
jgi:hypothetical protein